MTTRTIPASYAKVGIAPAARPAASGRRRQASASAARPSVPAVTCSKFATANGATSVPSANATSVGAPKPGAIPSEIRPTRKTQTRNAMPLESSRTAQSRTLSGGHSTGGGTRRAAAPGSSSTDIPGALSE